MGKRLLGREIRGHKGGFQTITRPVAFTLIKRNPLRSFEFWTGVIHRVYVWQRGGSDEISFAF